MGKIKHLVCNSVAWGVEEVNKFYREGNVKGFMFQVLKDDGTFITCHCGDIGYINKLGLLESAKADIINSALCGD